MTPDPEGGGDVLEAPTRTEVGNAGAPILQLGGYEGPLDLLLELARAQRVDLTRLSIGDLAEQFAAAVEAATAARRLPLHQLGDWLVMAAWLLLLRARLLLPVESAAGQEARREAVALREQLARRAAIRRLADWLARRPQLGREVFGRGRAEEPDAAHAAIPTADITGLLRACLAVLERPGQGGSYRPEPLLLWRVPEALERLRRMLPVLPDGATLEHFLPLVGDAQSDIPLQRRAALASTLMAGLKLCREGTATLDQNQLFGQILMVPVRHTAA
jgi:segregation and condensation protein A